MWGTASRRGARTLAGALREGRAAARLDLSGGHELRCVNMMCAELGGPCVCRLAAVLAKPAVRAGLKELVLKDAGLRVLPDAVADLDNLEVLDVSGNPELRSLPQGLAALRKLRVLDARGSAALAAVDLPGVDVRVGELDDPS